VTSASILSDAVLEKATMRKVASRIVPFLMLCYFFAFLDRVNIGFAALQMTRDLSLSDADFGLAAGIFFVSYCLFEVPSNLALEKVGARLWIARIMVTWGLVSAAMAWVTGPHSFFLMRFLLGAAEAGFFPGVILYLTYWLPSEYRARTIAVFMVAIPASSFLGSPVSAALLGLEGRLGLHGWQWLFVVEGIPTVLLGVLSLAILRNGPHDAAWLSPEQREWLRKRLSKERAQAKAVPDLSVWRALSNGHVLAASLIYGGSAGASACLSIWLPQIIKSHGLSNLETGLLNSLPFGVAAVVMVLWGRHSDRTNERVWHTAAALTVTAVSLGFAIAARSIIPTVVIFCFAVAGTYAAKGPFWALCTEWVSARTAAAGIAAINAIGSLWSGLSTYLFGAIKGATGSYALGLFPLVVLASVGAGLVLMLGRPRIQRSIAISGP
jgi:MFS family permease